MQHSLNLVIVLLSGLLCTSSPAQGIKPVSPANKTGDSTQKPKEPPATKPSSSNPAKPAVPAATRVPPTPVPAATYDKGGRVTTMPNSSSGLSSGGGQTPQKK